MNNYERIFEDQSGYADGKRACFVVGNLDDSAFRVSEWRSHFPIRDAPNSVKADRAEAVATSGIAGLGKRPSDSWQSEESMRKSLEQAQLLQKDTGLTVTSHRA